MALPTQPPPPRPPLIRRQRLMLLLFLAFLVLVGDRFWRDRVDFSGAEPIRVLVLEIVPPGVGATPGLLAFNDRDGKGSGDGPTVRAIGEFYARQYRRYRPEGRPDIQVTVSGPHEVHIDPPDVDDPEASTLVRLGRSFQYYWYFRSVARSIGVGFDQYDIRIVAQFVSREPGGQLEAESMASRKQRFGVVRLDLESTDWLYATVTLLHEIGHTLGATDKYDERFLGQWPYGYAHPERVPPFPQTHGELMAVDVPLSPDSEREVTSIDELAVGMRTAWEFGWVDDERMEAYYAAVPEVARPPAASLTPAARPQ